MDNKINCICTVFEEIDGFSSNSEFERFQRYIANLVEKKSLIPIKSHCVNRDYSIPIERFKCVSCHKIWILKHPDFPFKGLWKSAK